MFIFKYMLCILLVWTNINIIRQRIEGESELSLFRLQVPICSKFEINFLDENPDIHTKERNMNSKNRIKISTFVFLFRFSVQ